MDLGIPKVAIRSPHSQKLKHGQGALDDDVVTEKERIARSDDLKTEVLVMKDLTKVYNPGKGMFLFIKLVIVSGYSFSIGLSIR